MPGLTLNDIVKTWDDEPVLSDITIKLPEGELLVLLGPSGCGKSTMLRLIAGLEELDSGQIFIGERRVDKLQPKDRNVAMVFQNYSLYPHMTVEKNLDFPLKVAKYAKSERRERIAQTAELLGLTDQLKMRPGQLSGGQRQRVALGRAIIRQPDLFLLDEPLSNLDAELRVRMRREIVALQKQLKTTMVYVTHDQTEALTMADRIAVLNDGILHQVGTPQELYEDPDDLFVAQFLGQPKINTIEILNVARLGHLFPGVEPPESVATSRFTVAIRPEGIAVHESGELKGSLAGKEYLGDHLVLKLLYKGEALTAVVDKSHPISDSVQFDIRPHAYYFFDENGKRA